MLRGPKIQELNIYSILSDIFHYILFKIYRKGQYDKNCAYYIKDNCYNTTTCIQLLKNNSDNCYILEKKEHIV